MSFYKVTTNLPPHRPVDAMRIVAWLTFAYCVSFTLAHAVIS